MKNNSYVYVVLLLLLVVIGGYFFINKKSASVTLPAPVQEKVTYSNPNYGFFFDLPDSWKDYAVLNTQWQGRDIASGTVTETGPLITLRHPLWTTANPREDMPVMVFTPAQWALVQSEKLAVSAAPIPPSLLGQNSKFVLALPPRYNFDYKTGFEEVDQIVHTLKAFEPTAN